MSAALTTIATVTAADVTAADAFGGFVALIVGIVSFLAISGLALSMTIGASKSPGTLAITGIAGLLSLVIALGLYMSLSASHHGALEVCTGKTWDQIGGIIALLVGTLSFLSLGGLAVVMTLGSFVSKQAPVTSWPTELEPAFQGFDRRVAAAQSRAWTAAVIAGVCVFVFAFGIYQGVTPDIKDLSKDMNMSNLTKKSKGDAPAAAPAPAPEKKEAPAPAPAPAEKKPEAAPAP